MAAPRLARVVRRVNVKTTRTTASLTLTHLNQTSLGQVCAHCRVWVGFLSEARILESTSDCITEVSVSQ